MYPWSCASHLHLPLPKVVQSHTSVELPAQTLALSLSQSTYTYNKNLHTYTRAYIEHIYTSDTITLTLQTRDGELWASELRQVTVVFANLGLKNHDLLAAAKYGDAMRRCNEVLQVCMYVRMHVCMYARTPIKFSLKCIFNMWPIQSNAPLIFAVQCLQSSHDISHIHNKHFKNAKFNSMFRRSKKQCIKAKAL